MALNQSFISNLQSTPLHFKNPLILSISISLSICIVVSSIISLKIVFPSEPTERPFCGATWQREEATRGAFYMTEDEVADFYWSVAFLPSFVVFLPSVLCLVTGICVAYTAPKRHFFLKIIETHFCASRNGGVRFLSILNSIFALIFTLTALILGSTLLTLKTRCSVSLFFCFEISSWSLVILHGLTAFCLKRKDVIKLDGQESNLNLGLEMLGRNNEFDNEIDGEMERRVNEGFKKWMGPIDCDFSDDESESPDDYLGLESEVV